MKSTKLQMLDTTKLVTLKRNPQYLTPKQMESLKASMRRDGFVVPILVRQTKPGTYEVISGNHRFMAANELGLKKVPCVVSDMSDRDAKRLAVNLNTIHGEPNPELLAPFLADMDLDLLKEIHIEDDQLDILRQFDASLAASLSQLEPPDQLNNNSAGFLIETCKCEKCGKVHVKPAP